MKKELKIQLNDELYQKLLSKFENDENALKTFLVHILDKLIEANPNDPSKNNLDTTGLKDYLEAFKTGRRGYGIKGQGW